MDINQTKLGDNGETLPVTVVVPVKNEEQNLPNCLSALGRFAHVVVVDSRSSDLTVSIAKAAGAEVLQFVWNGRYPKKRNWMLTTYAFKTEWVLFLDADELIDENFCRTLQKTLSMDQFDGFWLNYTNYFMGVRLRFGLPQQKLALFKLGQNLYERIDEEAWSSLDMEIHEHPLITGKVGYIDIPIQHNDYRGLSRFLNRHLEYASWEARRFLELNGLASAKHFTRRQKFKYKYINCWWYPWLYFIYSYLIKLGFLDGKPGFLYAFYKLWYYKTIRLLIQERQKISRG